MSTAKIHKKILVLLIFIIANIIKAKEPALKVK